MSRSQTSPIFLVQEIDAFLWPNHRVKLGKPNP